MMSGIRSSSIVLTRDYARHPWCARGEHGELLFVLRHPLLPGRRHDRAPHEDHGTLEVVSPDDSLLLVARDRGRGREVRAPDGSPYGRVDYFPGRTPDGGRVMYQVSGTGPGPTARQVFRGRPVTDPRIRNIAGPAYLEIVADDETTLAHVFRYANGFARRVETCFAVPVEERIALLCAVAEATRWPDLKR